ncbi:MAG: hypothetical protein WCK37_02680 [Candidatus Falkowbacteria bacterium]
MNLALFFQRYKKIIFGLLFILVCILIGYFIWQLFFAPVVTPGVKLQPISTTTPGALPSAGEGGQQVGSTTGPGSVPESKYIIPGKTSSGPSAVAAGGLTNVTTLTKGETLSPTISSDGKSVQYYNKGDGKFYRINNAGEAVPLSDTVFHDVSKVTWAPNAGKAVIEYPDQSKIVYDFNTEKQVTLPKHWEDFTFSPNSDQLVMKSLATDPDNRWLIVANADGSKARAIENIGTNDATVIPSWSPNNQTVAMYTQGIDLNRKSVFFVGLNGENFKSITTDGRGFQPKWAPSGDKLLYSDYTTDSDLKPTLWIVGAQGDNIGAGRKPLELQTWADKCTFASSNEVYCAVPEDLPTGAGMFPETALQSKDQLYKINTDTGTKQLIAIPDGAYNISNLMVSDNQGQLFFNDQKTNQIYKINLK